MKLVNSAKKFETSIEEQGQDFSIGNASVVIEILRNRLYKHKIRTLVQEYISNARDASREANSKRPIEIQVPTSLEPVFKVRDFGLGISLERMSKVFIQYGASTKRDSNSQTGGFGIGAKSAWAYTDSFTIRTAVDGVERVFVAHTGANNNGRLDCIEVRPTKDQNGTTIEIAVNPKDVSQFRDSVLRAVYFWNETDAYTLTNCEMPPKPDYSALTSDLSTLHDVPSFLGLNWQDAILKVDGIPYALPREITDKHQAFKMLKSLTRETLVFDVSNGVVEVSASREELTDSEFTNKSLAKLFDKAYKTIHKDLKSQLDKGTTPEEYLKIYLELSKQFHMGQFGQVQGYSIDNEHLTGEALDAVIIENVHVDWDGKVEKTPVKGRSRWANRAKISLQQFGKLYHYDTADTIITSNYRIREYFKNDKTMLIVRPKSQSDADLKAFHKVVSDLSVKNLNTISFVKPKKEERVKISKTKAEFAVHTVNNARRKTETVTLETNNQKWLYVTMNGAEFTGFNLNDFDSMSDYIEHATNYKLCGLSKDSVKKVEGDANFKPYTEWLENFKLSQKDIQSQIVLDAKNDTLVSKLKRIPNLKCKVLKQALKVYETYYNRTGIILPDAFVAQVKQTKEYKNFIDIDVKLTQTVNSKYPLLNHVESREHKMLAELEFYINAKA